MSYPVKTDEHGEAIPTEPQTSLSPAKSVPKRYRKFANKIPDRQLYKVSWAAYGLIFRCVECGRDIPALEKHRRLCFREPLGKYTFTRKVCIALCKDCDDKLRTEKETTGLEGRQMGEAAIHEMLKKEEPTD